MSKVKGKKTEKGKRETKKKSTADVIVSVTKLLKRYERNCSFSKSVMAPSISKALKAAIEADTFLTKFILESIQLVKEDDLPVLFVPFITSIRQERYLHIKDLYVWDYPVTYQDMAEFALFLAKPFYHLRLIEFMDCLLEPITIKRFSQALPLNEKLTILNLDYNEFGDDGMVYLCEGLHKNTTLLSLSLCYCNLGIASGTHLGQIVSTTAIRDVYLDGNNLQCEGTMELIKLCVDQAENEAFERMKEAQLKAEEAFQMAAEKEMQHMSGIDISGDEADDNSHSASNPQKLKMKGKKKKKKKKGPPEPPPVGPWICKLHLADNGIDGLGAGGSFVPIICMRLFKKLLGQSKGLEELDLEDNLIGEVAALEILDGLAHRKEQKLGGVKVRITNRLTADTFNSILKLGSGLKKKKRGKGKKKKR